MNPASATRRRADVEKLRALADRIPGILAINSVTGNPATKIRLRLWVPTARDENFPRNVQRQTDAEIILPECYPLPPGPAVNFLTPVWHPNIYPSGRWCTGTWQITENLELFVIRMMKVLAFDRTIVNADSAANYQAAVWYRNLTKTNPRIFPTMDLGVAIAPPSKPALVWNTIR